MRAHVRELAAGALAAIEANRRRIDDLNVYPVPDGDTGTNLALTVRAVADALTEDGTDEPGALAHEIAHAALLGARGNSGVILSQIVRGAGRSLAETGDVARALRAASDVAYAAVRAPAEGTMLTAIRELAEAAERGEDLRGIVAAGDACVIRTQELLPVLRDAGVVDAGAAGLVEILRGIVAAEIGEPLPPAPEYEELSAAAIHQELSRYRYCTGYVVQGRDLDARVLEAELDQFGDSLLVVGDATALKVHVHTDDPGRALSLATARGAIAAVEIADMHEQTLRREQRLLSGDPAASSGPAQSSLVAVASGSGNRLLFESFGAIVVDGGATMNPSTAVLLGAIEAVTGEEVVLLPNDANVIMAAEQAARHATKTTHVVPTTSVPAGLAAAVAFNPEASGADNVAAISAGLADVATGAVTIASRDVQLNGVAIEKGKWLALANGEPIAGGDTFEEAARAVVDRLLAKPHDVLTLLIGADGAVLDGLLEELARAYPAVEVEVHDGGQPHYPLLIAAE